MIKTFQRYEIKKVLIEDWTVNLPEEVMYVFEYGYRLTHAIIPVWTEWEIDNGKDKEEIYEYKIITIDVSYGFNYIKFETISIHHVNEYYNSSKDTIQNRIATMLCDGVPRESIRTREQFMEDYNKAIRALTGWIDIKSPEPIL